MPNNGMQLTALRAAADAGAVSDPVGTRPQIPHFVAQESACGLQVVASLMRGS